jgi:Fe-S cluster assembly protein SufD
LAKQSLSATIGELDTNFIEVWSKLNSDPEWTRELRFKGFEVFRSLPQPWKDQLPPQEFEEWRRTDISKLALEEMRITTDVKATTDGLVKDSAVKLEQVGNGLDNIRIQNSQEELILMPLVEATKKYGDLVESHLFKLAKPERDKFLALHSVLFSGGAFVVVPKLAELQSPIYIHFAAGQTSVFNHSLVIIEDGAHAVIVEDHSSDPSSENSLATSNTEIYVGRGAQVEYIFIQRHNLSTWHFANQYVILGPDSSIKTHNIDLGSHFSKTRLEISLSGQGSEAILSGVLFGKESQFFDHHTLQDHIAPNTKSDLLFKGALTDSAKSLYVGLIRVEKNARFTDAYQANRNLLLSNTSKADSIPMLEIGNNEVRCTHGATVSPIDPEQLFYLQSRGLDIKTAKRLIVEGFLGEVTNRIPIKDVTDVLSTALNATLP